MHIFTLDPSAVSAHIARLRGDATTLSPTTLPPLPASGPVARLSAALAAAVDTSNSQAELLSAEALRIADTMDALTRAAVRGDNATAQSFEVLQ